MGKCKTCGAPVNLAPDGDPRYLAMNKNQSGQLSWSVARIAELEAERDRMREALTPSADTKAAYMSEFEMAVTRSLPGGDTDYRRVSVPWTAIKEIMAAISARAGETEK